VGSNVTYCKYLPTLRVTAIKTENFNIIMFLKLVNGSLNKQPFILVHKKIPKCLLTYINYETIWGGQSERRTDISCSTRYYHVIDHSPMLLLHSPVIQCRYNWPISGRSTKKLDLTPNPTIKKIMKQWTYHIVFLSLDEILNSTIPFFFLICVTFPLTTAMKTGMTKGRSC
jgi:hypothetical protein